MSRRLPYWIGILAMLALGLLYLPMLAMAVASVNAGRHGFAWQGFTLDWYRRLFQDPYVMEAARNTLILATASTFISTVLGTLLAIGMSRYPWPRWLRAYLDLAIYLPVVTPDIIFAAALVVAFSALRLILPIFNLGLPAMIVAHVTFQVAFVALIVQCRLVGIGRTIEEAARDLYADTPCLLRRVLIPLLMPGIVAGAMLAFTLSLDDFVISFFTCGPNSQTLPILIYGSVRRGLSPEIHALSTLIFLATVLLALGLERMTSFGKE